MTTPDNKLKELMEEFGTAMLVTRSKQGQIRARPMHLADIDSDGTLWLMTDRESAKVAEIEQDVQVNLTMQSKLKFVSISGTASLVEDRAKVAQLWKESWKVWFPGGKDDPKLILLTIKGQAGEYWDNSGVSGIKYLFEAGKAYLTGTRPDIADDTKIHGKVKL
ncbi:pyridoxamine 5'-phosphate oxidase family protein [soil metagenome]